MLKGSKDGPAGPFVPAGEPGLKNPIGPQTLFRQLIEFFRVEQAGTGGLYRRRRIDHNDIELVSRAIEVSPPIIDDDASFGIT